MRIVVIGMVAVLAGGCAVYRPAPLPSVDTILGASWPSGDVPVAHPRLPAALVDVRTPRSDLDPAWRTLVSSPDLAAARTRAGVEA